MKAKPAGNREVLITPSLEASLTNAFKLGEYINAHPYTWLRKQNRPSLLQSDRRLLLWRFNVLLLIARTGFIAVRFIYISTKDVTLMERIHLGFVFVYYVSAVALSMTHWFCGFELAELTWQFMKYFSRFQELYCKVGESPRLIKLYPLITGQMVKSWYANIAFLSGAGALKPNSPEFLTSLADDPTSLSSWIIALCVCLDAYILLVVIFSAMPIMFTLLGFHFVLKKSIPELIEDEAKLTNRHLHQPQVALREFKAMILLIDLDTHVYRIFLPAIQVCLGAILVLSLYGCIRLSGVTAMVLIGVGGNMSAVLGVVFGLMATVHTQTTAVCDYFRLHALRNLANSQGPRAFGLQEPSFPLHKTQLKILKPVGIRIGSVYYIDKMQVVSMFEIIFSYVVTLLLMDPT